MLPRKADEQGEALEVPERPAPFVRTDVSRSPAEGSSLRGAGPSRSPAEGSSLRGASPSRSPAEGSSLRGASPSRSPAEGSSAEARNALHERFAGRLAVRGDLSRRVVSYQGNKTAPGLRWVKYKEGFSVELVRDALRMADGHVLDPFAGIGTAALVAAASGRAATGFEIMPVGARTASAISWLARQQSPDAVKRAGKRLLCALDSGVEPPADCRFRHVPITRQAFSPETEDAIGRARAFLGRMRDHGLRLVLDVACMSVLEEASFTRKDGQYLRWDNRCGRNLRGSMNKGRIPSYREALERRLHEIVRDHPALAARYGASAPRIVEGSALAELPKLADDSVGLTITSPPYANRYDYTRTYALELAWLGYDRTAFGELRQALVSATVENHSKEEQLQRDYPRRDTLRQARTAVASQSALVEALCALQARRSQLSNPHVIRLLANYFSEMALVIAELARVTQPGGKVVMVNDNVQYHGEEVPVDLILSAIAEDCGFVCEEIGVLPRGKGNASQQMGRFGRRELRKCVYRWRLPKPVNGRCSSRSRVARTRQTHWNGSVPSRRRLTKRRRTARTFSSLAW